MFALRLGLTPAEVVHGVLGRPNQVDYLVDSRFSRVATLGCDAGLEAEPHEAEQHGLENVAIVLVERAVYERASIEVIVGWQAVLTARRRRVVAVGVALSNAAVLAVDVDLTPSIPGDSAGRLNRFLLGVEAAGDPFGTRLADCPFVPAWDDVLAPCCHWWDSCVDW